MVNAQKISAGEIQDHMPVVGSDGHAIGTVDRVEGGFIKLMRNDPASGGMHRWLPVSAVAGLDGGIVRLSLPAAQAGQAMVTEAEMAEQRELRLEPFTDEGGPPHGSRGRAHGGPKGKREHGMSGQASGPPGQTSFGVNQPVDGDFGPDGARRARPAEDR